MMLLKINNKKNTKINEVKQWEKKRRRNEIGEMGATIQRQSLKYAKLDVVKCYNIPKKGIDNDHNLSLSK